MTYSNKYRSIKVWSIIDRLYMSNMEVIFTFQVDKLKLHNILMRPSVELIQFKGLHKEKLVKHIKEEVEDFLHTKKLLDAIIKEGSNGKDN